MWTHRLLLYLSLSLAVQAGTAFAQTNAPGTNSIPARQLSLAEAMDLASLANLDVQLSAEKIHEAAGKVTSERANLLPELKATASEARQDHSTAAFGLPEHGRVILEPVSSKITYPGTPSKVVDNFNLPTKVTLTEDPVNLDFDLSDTTGPYNFFNGKLYLDVPLIDLQNFRMYEASKATEQKSHRDTDAQREQAMADTAQLYEASLCGQEGVRVLKKKVELHEQRVALSEDLLKSGVATALDVSKEKSDLSEARSELLQAQMQYANSIRELKRQLDIDPMEDIALTDPLDFRPLPEQDPKGALDLSYQRRPDLQAQQQQEKAAQIERDASRADYYPTLKATANYGEQGLSPDDTVDAWYIGAQASVPIFDSFKRSGNLSQKESQYQQQKNRTRDLENQIWNEVFEANDELVYNESLVISCDDSVKYNDDVLTEQKDAKEAGTATDLDVTSAEVDLADAKFKRVTAVYNYNLAVVKWYKAIGYVRDATLERAEHPLWDPGPHTDAEESKDGVQ